VNSVWRLLAHVRGADAASAVFALLDDSADAVSAFEAAPEEWRVEAYRQSRLLNAELGVQLALAAAAAGGTLAEFAEENLPARDWLAENRLSFPPLRVGRFFVYGSHHDGKVPAGAIGIAIDAATAFGTGEHPSTRGCLLALERLARRRRFHRPLDIGTGTGILSIATAKLLHRKILAGDIDLGAICVARHNAACNGVGGRVQSRKAPGYRDRLIRKSRYDLILSNILARPLAVMAADLARRMAPDGRAVLSGLLRRQEPIVLAPHRGCGIVLDHRLVIDGWSTLVMRGRHRLDVTKGAEAPICESARPKYRSGLLGPGELLRLRQGHRRRGRIGHAVTLDEARNLRTVKPDIGERVIVECHQLGVGLLPVPPLGKAPSGGNEKIDCRHG
jgi:ribosomal protein L11 methyltransferase